MIWVNGNSSVIPTISESFIILFIAIMLASYVISLHNVDVLQKCSTI